MLATLLLLVAGLAAGVLNAVAGGGTFLTFPALVWIGVPPVMANATATLSALPGYLGSGWGYRHDIRAEGALPLPVMLGLALAGGLAGALLLLVTSERAFSGIVPWLLLAATLLFAAAPHLLPRLAGGRGLGAGASAAVLLVTALYGGYFNGGLGILLLAVFSLMGFADLHAMNGLKNLVSALLAAVSSVTWAAAGLVAWEHALVLALAMTAGGYLGAHYARRIRNTAPLRAVIVAVGLAMTLAFFLA
jgi:uncharacterized protein